MNEILGIAGSGTIATGLAAVGSTAGEVVLWARSEESADRARGAVLKAAGRLDGADAERVQVVTELDALAAATFLVEAVVEHHESKADLLSDLGELASEQSETAILATTTSSLSVTELAEASGHPERFVGLHVFNPVPRMKLVELVFPDAAAEETRERSRALCEALGKTVVEVPDVPGFVVNRILFPYLFSAVELMERTGLEPEAVDQCMTLGAGMPMGPIALLDFVGLDVAKAIGETIGTPIPARVDELVSAQQLGRKSGQGFYVYGS